MGALTWLRGTPPSTGLSPTIAFEKIGSTNRMLAMLGVRAGPMTTAGATALYTVDGGAAVMCGAAACAAATNRGGCAMRAIIGRTRLAWAGVKTTGLFCGISLPPLKN